MRKNWKTSLAGLITGLLIIIKGVFEKRPEEIAVGIGVIVTGVFAADAKPDGE